ncbi:FMN-binding negative transcriptional regulator [Mucilaginibacter sp. Bleaf8]|uniref:FMN-binding negative transcriptional regulator n=1 Tax=Mucilaginibacter sp. Bleaf8 TaxID=2834430 RepID=UPI001BCFD4DC|nr:FMN-binding negative transcriptional regulator [Mucilaginibacter sp. Bleaf8]MBS7565251.1 FMN-binding negative transcriptional regulator [Mucilaginibacter sp. Bleaf8]
MYTPKHFQITDTSEAVAFMQRYSFATLISINDNLPIAAHLPFVVKEQEGKVILSSHLAKPNPQSDDLTHGTALVIFAEPHAYIAPKHYEKELNVPTWNYLAVHAYGKPVSVNDEHQQLKALEEMISYYDADYLQQWAGLPIEYKLKLCKGITVFEMEVTDLQGKKKLSQNRSAIDKQSITTALSNSSNDNEKIIAEYMRKE